MTVTTVSRDVVQRGENDKFYVLEASKQQYYGSVQRRYQCRARQTFPRFDLVQAGRPEALDVEGVLLLDETSIGKCGVGRVSITNEDGEVVYDTQTIKEYREFGTGHQRLPRLAVLAEQVLNRAIQVQEHSSVEDAQATMDLFLRRKEEFEATRARGRLPETPDVTTCNDVDDDEIPPDCDTAMIARIPYQTVKGKTFADVVADKDDPAEERYEEGPTDDDRFAAKDSTTTSDTIDRVKAEADARATAPIVIEKENAAKVVVKEESAKKAAVAGPKNTTWA